MKLNKAHIERVRKLVEKAEVYFAADAKRLSAGYLWKADVRAIRYLLDKLADPLPTAGGQG